MIMLAASTVAFAFESGENAPPAPAATYVPQSVVLRSLTPASSGKVCVVGYSKQKTGVKIGPYDPISVPAYSLTRDASNPLGVWTPMTAPKISALEVGAEINTALLTPAGGRYLNAATMTFFYVKSPPSTFKCSSIFLNVVDATAGIVGTPYYPFPRGLFEASVYPVWDAATKTYSVQTTIDTSNVDSFELPLAANVAKITKIVPTPAAPPYWRVTSIPFGNPVTTSGISRRSLISGSDDTGGVNSPFSKWLSIQPGDKSVSGNFLSLAYGATLFPYAMIESPNDYLNLKCVLTNPATNAFTPKGCNLNYVNQALVNLRDPLNRYFDKEIKTFFSNAVKAGSVPLSVMGDASGTIASQPWIARANVSSCPLYLNPDNSSISFQNQSKTGSLVLCNPLDQVVLMNQKAGDAPPGVTVTAKQSDDDHPYYAYATFSVTPGQCADAQTQKRLGWNLGQPDTGFVANITKIDCATNKLSGPVIAPPSGALGTTTQSQAKCPINATTQQPVCPQPNPSFTSWLYSNIPVVPGVNWSESASQMVFANDGAFAAWQSVLYPSNADLQTVALSVARNIVSAFNRGIANCNNVTMSPKPTTGPCVNVTALSSSQMNPSSAANASDAYWSNEANFYPAGGVQNYYAQYLHTAAVSQTGVFLPPQLPISISSKSNQGLTMGMAYGFAYDENPTYLSLKPTDIPNVPSKLDPIPSNWWPAASDGAMILGVVIGKSD